MQPDIVPDPDARAAQLVELAAIAETPGGKRYLARWLRDMNVLGGVYQQNATIHKLAGVQEQGLAMLREIHEASPGAALNILQMILEEGNHHGRRDNRNAR